jgi:hypothetical protein
VKKSGSIKKSRRESASFAFSIAALSASRASGSSNPSSIRIVSNVHPSANKIKFHALALGISENSTDFDRSTRPLIDDIALVGEPANQPNAPSARTLAKERIISGLSTAPDPLSGQSAAQ